ncbi:hypothetical protein ABPG75_007838 [Micractinium tetrahymenae]
MDAALHSLLLANAPQLSEAEITGPSQGGLQAVPSLLGSQRFRKLKLRPHWGEALSLPQGPYLAALEELDLSNCRLRQLPPSLAAATRLRRLVLYSNPALHMPDSCVAGTLARLQQLSRLDLDSWCPPPMTPQAFAALLRTLG